MADVIAMVEQGMGYERMSQLRRKEDEYQMFWVGVLEALPRANGNPEAQVPYLITAGYGAVKNYRRAENTSNLYKVCPNCGRTYGYRASYCSDCGTELENRRRHVELSERHEARMESGILERVLLEGFVSTLSGRIRYIARRWLIDRADIFYDNHAKQIAAELGISAPAVAKYKKRIKRELMYWMHKE